MTVNGTTLTGTFQPSPLVYFCSDVYLRSMDAIDREGVRLLMAQIFAILALRLKQDLVPDQAVDDPRSKNPLNEH